MSDDLIFKDNGKETSRIPFFSNPYVGTKAPETKLEIKMTEPIHAKISEEDYQKVLDLFKEELTQSVIPNNPLSKVQKTRTTYSKLKEKNVVEGLVSFDGEEAAWLPIETINGIYSFINKTFDGLNI